jgi:hypothetical protein
MIPEPLLALNRYLPSCLYLRVERRTFEVVMTTFTLAYFALVNI